MHDDTLPMAINPTEIISPDNGSKADGVSIYHPWFAVLTSALSVAQSSILSVEDVAAVLRCSIDTVRRIPFDDLASYDGPGRGVLYRMEDVQHYLHQRNRCLGPTFRVSPVSASPLAN